MDIALLYKWNRVENIPFSCRHLLQTLQSLITWLGFFLCPICQLTDLLLLVLTYTGFSWLFGHLYFVFKCVVVEVFPTITILWTFIGAGNTCYNKKRGCYLESTRWDLGFLSLTWINTLRPRQNGRHFPDDSFKCIFLNENARIWFNKSLKFVPKVRINTIAALVQIMAWRRSGDKPLIEPMVVSLLTHICVTRPQWVKFDTSMEK